MITLASTYLKIRLTNVPLIHGKLHPSSFLRHAARQPLLANFQIRQIALSSTSSHKQAKHKRLPSHTQSLKLDLGAYNEKRWGWVIYRCTYADELDEAWTRFKTLLEAKSVAELANSDTPELLDSLRWTFVEDKETLDGATPVDLRPRFQEWAAKAMHRENPRRNKPFGFPSSRYKYFIHINEQVLRSFMHLNKDVESMNLEYGWVHLVDSQWEHGDGDGDEVFEPLYGSADEDVGWMRLPGGSLSYSFYDFLSTMPENWYAEYVRPPAIAHGY